MNRVEIWQHPFVDVFKFTNISDWKLTHKEGEVLEEIDRIIGRKIFHLQGSVSASNFIQIPKQKSELKTLGLTGKFIYIQLSVDAGKLFSMHLDLIVKNAQTNRDETLKVSLSNLFKENKIQNSLQLTCRIGGKWTILCVDMRRILSTFFENKFEYKNLRSLTLCANMKVRGVYTSDILYSPKTLPKEMSFKGKLDDWNENYEWRDVLDNKENNYMAEEVKSVIAKTKEEEIKTQKPTKLKSKSKKQPSEEELRKRASSMIEEVKKKSIKDIDKKARAEHIIDIKTTASNQNKQDQNIDRVLESNSAYKEVENMGNSDEIFFPDPILHLSKVYNVTASRDSLVWVHVDIFSSYPAYLKEKTTKILLYTSGYTIAALNPANLTQFFLFGHNSPVLLISLSDDQMLLASAQDDPCTIYLWNLRSRKSPVKIENKRLAKINTVCFNSNGNKLLVCGLDELNRYVLIVFDISKANKSREASILAQQLSDFHINSAIFFPKDDSRLISCGKENVRFWRIKSGHMPGTSVSLGQNSRDEWMNLAFTQIGNSQKLIVGGSSGNLLQISLISKELEAAFKLHDGSIYCIISKGDIVITASADNLLRVWPKTFTETYLEVQHKSPVLAMDILGTQVSCVTQNCTLGILDLDTSEYLTVLRCHPETIVSVSIHPNKLLTSTIYEDKSIKIWRSCTTELLYEFSCPLDNPVCSVFHPNLNILACGFLSGSVRLFDLDSSRVKDEHHQHSCAIELILFSKDGNWLISQGEDGSTSVYDGSRDFQPVKDIPNEYPGSISASFSGDSRYFALVGCYGNNILIWETKSLTQRFKLNLSSPVNQIEFAEDCRHLLALTHVESDKLMYYVVSDEKVTLEKEILVPLGVKTFRISKNNRYLSTIGHDNIVRIWDFFLTKSPQGFLGHIDSILDILWGQNCEYLLTCASKDGMCVWDFFGDKSISSPKLVKEIEYIEEVEAIQDMTEEANDQILNLEKETADYLKQVELIQTQSQPHRRPHLRYMFGYTPSRYNLHWASEKGWFLYTHCSNIIKTLLHGDKKQKVFHEHLNDVDVIAVSSNFQYIASAESMASIEGSAKIIIWDSVDGEVARILEYHDRCVKCMAISPCNNYLISVGNIDDCLLAVWDIKTGKLLTSSILENYVIQVAWVPMLSSLEFVTLSTRELIFWRLNQYNQLEFQPGQMLEIPEILTCVEYSKYFEKLASHLLFVGTQSGSILIYNSRTNTLASTIKIVDHQINCISSKEDRVIIGGESPQVYSWKWSEGVFSGQPDILLLEGNVESLAFNSTGNEGLVGTHQCTIWYIDWQEHGTLRIISSHAREITCIASRNLIASASKDQTIRIWNEETLEQEMQFRSANHYCLALAFHPSLQYLCGGFSDGSLRVFDLLSTKCIGTTKTTLGTITSLIFSPDGENILVGSETGAITVVFVERWNPLNVRIIEFGMVGSRILSLDIKDRTIIVSTVDGKASIWEKKFTAQSLLDKKLFENEQSEFNLIDVYNVLEHSEKAKNFYPQPDSLECKVRFDPVTDRVCLIIIRGLQYLLFRNYAQHQIIRRVSLSGFPMSLSIDGAKIAIGLGDRRILVYENGQMQEYQGISESVGALVFSKNGLVSCSGTELTLWSV